MHSPLHFPSPPPSASKTLVPMAPAPSGAHARLCEPAIVSADEGGGGDSVIKCEHFGRSGYCLRLPNAMSKANIRRDCRRVTGRPDAVAAVINARAAPFGMTRRHTRSATGVTDRQLELGSIEPPRRTTSDTAAVRQDSINGLRKTFAKPRRP